MTAIITTTPRTLTALDRCDRCGAQAFVASVLEGGAELLWCAHHWREHGDAVALIAVHVHDETSTLE